MEKISLFIADATGLPDPLLEPDLFNGLPPYRQEKIRRLMPASARTVSLAAGLLLQLVLERYGISLAKIRIGETGKPFVPGLHFNVAHSYNRIICAVGNCAVGCDIEKMKNAPSGLAERYFSPEEIEHLRAAEDKDRAFFTLWTRKESYIKMTGEGLACPLDSFSALPDAPVIREGSPVRAHIRTIQIDRYICSICTEEETELEVDLEDLHGILYG